MIRGHVVSLIAPPLHLSISAPRESIYTFDYVLCNAVPTGFFYYLHHWPVPSAQCWSPLWRTRAISTVLAARWMVLRDRVVRWTVLPAGAARCRRSETTVLRIWSGRGDRRVTDGTGPRPVPPEDGARAVAAGTQGGGGLEGAGGEAHGTGCFWCWSPVEMSSEPTVRDLYFSEEDAALIICYSIPRLTT